MLHNHVKVLLLLGLLLASAGVRADEPVKEPEDKQTVDSKPVPAPRAASVNFKKELKLPYPTLSTLGARIDDARRKHDPVALAHAASELNVAEKVSGKQASVTSKHVLQEAAELAKLRSQAKELQAVLHVSDQVAAEQDLILSLKKTIALANERAKMDTEAIQSNLEPTWKPRKVIVNNYTTQYLTIWVNGIYKTEIPPGQRAVVIVEHRWNPTILKANGNEDIDTWGPRIIWGRFETYTWNING
jgi:hypothetical protein